VVPPAPGYQCRIASCKPDSAWRGLKSRPGPKAAVTAEPLDLSGFPAPGWRRVDAFAREYLRVPKGTGAGGPFMLRRWQLDIVRAMFPMRGVRPGQGDGVDAARQRQDRASVSAGAVWAVRR
jgi:hypothetical protein